MARRTLLAGAASFAHLFGRGPAAETPEDDDDKKQRKGESDEDYAQRCEDDEEARRAESDDADDEGMEDDDGEDDEDDDKKKGKKAKKAKSKKPEKSDDEDGDDEGDDDDDDGNEEAEKRGKKAERSRWTQVLQHPAAGGGRIASACYLLSTTGLSASRVIGLLKTTPDQGPSGKGRLAERMQGVRPANPGADGPEGRRGGPTMAEQIVIAGKKRRGEV